MPLLDYLHEEYYADGDLVVFRCSECGYTSLSLGSLHAHIEGHISGYTRLNIRLPVGRTSYGNFHRLMRFTDVLKVKDTTKIELDDVNGL